MTLEQVAGGFGDGVDKVVLVVCDDAHLRAEILSVLGAAGHRHHVVSSAAAARGVAASRVVNLALVDTALADGDAVVLGQHLGQDRRIPSLLLADGNDPAILRRSIAAGSFNVFLKPATSAHRGLAR